MYGIYASGAISRALGSRAAGAISVPVEPTGGGVCEHSTASPYNSYAIFCVGQSLVKQAEFRSWATSHKIGFKSLKGKYKGELENSFIINADDLDVCYSWYSREETVLLLSPMYRDGKMYGNREAHLMYQDKHQDFIGLFRWMDRDNALKRDNWTCDLTDGSYWVTEMPPEPKQRKRKPTELRLLAANTTS